MKTLTGRQGRRARGHRKAPRRGRARSAASWTWDLTKGTEVYVRKVAPLGDPMELTVRGYELSVRKGDAELIEVR